MACGCSGTLNVGTYEFRSSANICPSCQLDDSTFCFVFPNQSIIFTATVFNTPECTFTFEARRLHITGKGTLILNDSIAENADFDLVLFESTPFGGGEDSAVASANGTTANGIDIFATFTFVNGDLTVTPCSPLSPFSAEPSKSFTQLDEFIKVVKEERALKGTLAHFDSGRKN